ncbi:MAG: hypothetical protein JWP97_4587 [Labilithrix sp.]|nr:hypothetical protein [Labilithrix sp.]
MMLAVPVLLSLAGCGGPKKEAAAPETNPWSDYKGTYAGPVSEPSSPSAASDAKPEKVASNGAALKQASAEGAGPAPAKPVKKAAKKKKKKAGPAPTNGGELE